MARLKLKLTTGVEVEKPIVTCFKVEERSYLVLDAENVGSMGLPIILVCKIEDNVVKKITDTSEWQKAKDYLKGIIAGNSMDYVAVPAELSAEEIYYTQLTLPIASFDVIKNSYQVPEAVQPVEEVVVPEQPVIENPVIDQTPVQDEPIIPEVPVMDPGAPVLPIDPVVSAVEPVNPEAEVSTEVTNDIDFAASKEAFMQACENMYDALVAKFQAKLEQQK